MATYTKKLKTLAVHLMLDSEVVNIADTASDDMATRALNEFKKYETMHYVTEDGGQKSTNAIPYHAVQYIEVTEADGSVEREDPYGCDEGGSDTVTVTFEGNFESALFAYPPITESTEWLFARDHNPLAVAKGTTIVFDGVNEVSIDGEVVGGCDGNWEYTFNEDTIVLFDDCQE